MRRSNLLGDVSKAPRTGLRILHVAEPPLGGVINHLKDVVAGQAANPDIDRVTVITPYVNVAELRAASANSVQIHGLRYRRGSLLALLRLAGATLTHVRADRPDIVHLHSTVAGTVVRLILILLVRRPVIVYCPHGWALGGTRPRSIRWVVAWTERVLSYVTDAIVCVSDGEKRTAASIGIAPARCIVVKNGMPDLAMRIPPPAIGNRRLCLLYVGRMDKAKGFDIFIDALARLSDIADGVVVGGYVVDKPQAITIPSNVKLVGWRSHEEVLPFYQQADAVIIPSNWEGLPLVAIEAMRASRPVFGSLIAGLQETVVDGKTGRLFPANNVDALVDCIRSTDRRTLGAYGAAARDRFEDHFTSDRMNQQLFGVYRSLVPTRETLQMSLVTNTPSPNLG